MLAAWLLTKELKRKEAEGFLAPELLPFSKGRKFLKDKKAALPDEWIKVYPTPKSE